MQNNEKPFVSVIIPCRNEKDFIERCICSVLASDYPVDRLEVIVVDGLSTDGTDASVARIAEKDSRVTLLHNPQKVMPVAMNTGISRAKGAIIIPLGGHTEVAGDFVLQSVKTLTEDNKAWCVGGPIESISPNYIGRAIAAAMSSPFGVGNAMFRLGDFEGYVDTVAFGAYWRWVFDKIGLFDEELVRNQDDELNYRLILHGGKILMTPRIRSKYFTRNSLKKLWQQYFQYGFWRIRTMRKHKCPATIRQTVPLLFVLLLFGFLFAGMIWQPFWWLLLTELALYALALLLGIFDVGVKSGFRYALLAPLIFVILHFAYGLGGIWGIIRFVVLKGRGMKKPQEMELSR
jgi:glycosyltransferase involved in cell wall biosynthesis